MKRFVIWFSLFLFISSCLFVQGGIWKNLDQGNYKIGFKVFSLYDSTRTIINPKNFRPIQVSVWYPAEISGKSVHMTYKDYFLLSAEETDYKVSKAHKDSVVNNYKKLLLQDGISEKAIDEWFNTKMLAYQDANQLKGKFPLVVVAQGNFHSAHHQAFLCEFLASNGYVVITTPSQTRITGQLTDFSQAMESTVDQVKDMKFAVGTFLHYSNIDFSKVALIGHSFGGRSILLLQMEKYLKVKCLVSLDGGLGLNTAVDDIKKSPDFDPAKMDVPLLHFYEDVETMLRPDFRLINGFSKSKRFLVKIDDMHHFYFSSLGLVSGTIKGFHPLSKNLVEKYKMICNFTRDFLNAVFRSDDQDMLKLKEEYSSYARSYNFIKYQYK